MADDGRPLHETEGFFNSIDPQASSALYRIPAELRDRIFTFALAAFEDEQALYDTKAVWTRPLYRAPRRSHLALLRTCKIVYHETWYKPWALADHSFWLAANDRAPENAPTFGRFHESLLLIHKHQGEVEIEHIRFFAQMWTIDGSISRWRKFLPMPYFHPLAMTLTIRHTDWWSWESDETLHISSNIAKNHVLPSSTRKLYLELETLERKKQQLDSIVEQIKQVWSFSLTDGSLLSASQTTAEVQRWKGSSSLLGKRWCRDEAEPDTLHYYVVTITFERETSFVKPMSLPEKIVPTTIPDRLSGLVLDNRSLNLAGVPEGVTGDTAAQLLQTFRETQASSRARNRRPRRSRRVQRTLQAASHNP